MVSLPVFSDSSVLFFLSGAVFSVIHTFLGIFKHKYVFAEVVTVLKKQYVEKLDAWACLCTFPILYSTIT